MHGGTELVFQERDTGTEQEQANGMTARAPARALRLVATWTSDKQAGASGLMQQNAQEKQLGKES
jgi:hypothetical protein